MDPNLLIGQLRLDEKQSILRSHPAHRIRRAQVARRFVLDGERRLIGVVTD